ncbi:FdhD protein [Acetitomaculum ruminis DSM 5522]|uniref:FdhD protein n=1 Tax=Acetitomaculum ruminis DSM 5522 TaxID=1120918 RepID=A0A1I0VTC5_9FIRM|nr:formate dehydrogenase accessory sulfurtransferase FdhD [Acetitomaculum ruminis]SFA79614.1 FdhD protein [Acetitomaculum ruminis DSM 5522]
MSGRYEKVEYINVRREGETSSESGNFLVEHEMDIIINDKVTKHVYCSKKELKELVIGNLYTNGYVYNLKQIKNISFSDKDTKAIVTIDEKTDITKEIPLRKLFPIDWKKEWVFKMADLLDAEQPLYKKTKGAHSCFAFKGERLLFVCEDVGRHNAIDKAVGKVLLEGYNLRLCSFYTSGRVPHDMVTKMIYAGVPMFVSKGVPTTKAIELAKEYNLTLICQARRDGFKIFNI